MRLIIQHTPKCAGTSLLEGLRQAYGREAILVVRDGIADPTGLYLLDPERYFREARQLYPDHEVIHGHFPIRKFAHITDAYRVATIRHPLDRLISHYSYWKTLPPHPHHHLFTYVRDNDLSLTEFAKLPIIREFYRRLFFANVWPHDFDLLIFQERFEKGLLRVCLKRSVAT